jgi:outer membrane lipase/esterase
VQQVQQFVQTHPTLDPNAVYFIWSGANDLLTVLANTSPTSPVLQLLLLQAANTAANNVAQQVALLSAHGAKRVVVLSLPNIGYTPLINDMVTSQLVPASTPGLVKTITFTFNSMLNQQLGSVIANYHTQILYIDVFDILDNVILATKAGQSYLVGGQSFTFVNYNSPVCNYIIPPSPGVAAVYVPAIDCNMSSSSSDSANGYIFADDVHPTGEAHRLLSLVVEQKLMNWN